LSCSGRLSRELFLRWGLDFQGFGETIAVLMVVGNVAKVPTGVFQPVTLFLP